jgi:hypothetical protein
LAVNDRGQITGQLITNNQAFFYSDGILTPFGPSSDTGSGSGAAMNNKGEVAGWTFYSGGSAVLGSIYRDGQVSTFSGPSAAETEAEAINGRGEVAGVWTPPQHPLLYQRQVFTYYRGRFHDLGHAFGQSEEQDAVGGINRYGVIVGNGSTTTIPFGGSAAWVYYPGEGFADLNTQIPPYSGWFLQFANGINNRGQIAGTGLVNGVRHGYILTPVDNPDEDKSDQSETSE